MPLRARPGSGQSFKEITAFDTELGGITLGFGAWT